MVQARIPVVQAYINIFCKSLYYWVIALHHKSMATRKNMLLYNKDPQLCKPSSKYNSKLPRRKMHPTSNYLPNTKISTDIWLYIKIK